MNPIFVLSFLQFLLLAHLCSSNAVTPVGLREQLTQQQEEQLSKSK